MSQQQASQSRSFSEWITYIWAEGLARHVVVEKAEHRPVDLPLTFVVIAAVVAPWLVAIGVVIAVLKGYRLFVERRGDDGDMPEASEPLDSAPQPDASAQPVAGEQEPPNPVP